MVICLVIYFIYFDLVLLVSPISFINVLQKTYYLDPLEVILYKLYVRAHSCVCLCVCVCVCVYVSARAFFAEDPS